MFFPETVQEFYNNYGAKEWDRLNAKAYGKLVFHNHMLFISPHIGEGKRVLDAGCGSGRFSISVAGSGSRVTLLDLSDVQLSIAKEKMAEAGLSESADSHIHASVIDMGMLPDSCFDTVICYGAVLNYLFDEAGQAVKELVRVTKNGGQLLVSVNSKYGVLKALASGYKPELLLDFWGRPDYWEIPHMLETGDVLEHPDVPQPARHFFHATELSALLTEHGVCDLILGGAPVLLTGQRETAEQLFSNPAAWNTVLKAEAMSYISPHIADAGEFLMVKGTVRKS